jgi:hypothetical protein
MLGFTGAATQLTVFWQTKARAATSLALLGLVGCASTCGDSTQSSSAIGELGNGDFIYTCVGRTDPACGFDSFDPSDNHFPECIALGGRFRLTYTLRDASALSSDDISPFIRVESGNEDYFSGSDTFVARKVGRSAFLAREEEHVLDFIHLAVVAATQVRFSGEAGNPTDRVELQMGERKEVRVLPGGATCSMLGGAMAVQATTADPSVATATDGDTLEVYGAGVGTTTLVVHLGEPGDQPELTGSLSVVVTESPGTTDGTTTTGDTDGTGTDTDTDTDTDTGTGGTADTGDTDGTGDSTSGSSTGGSTGSTGG